LDSIPGILSTEGVRRQAINKVLPTPPKKLPLSLWTKKVKTKLYRLINQEIPKKIRSMGKLLKSNPTTIQRVIKRDLDKVKPKQTKLHELNVHHITNFHFFAKKSCTRTTLLELGTKKWSQSTKLCSG